MAYGHKQVLIKYARRSAEVDEGIAHLILQLWKHGIHTMMSCENNVPNNYIWINFSTPGDASKFLDLVATFSDEPNSIYSIMTSHSEEPGHWKYDIHTMDIGIESIIDEETNTCEDKVIGPHKFFFDVSIRFPKEDLDFIMKKLT